MIVGILVGALTLFVTGCALYWARRGARAGEESRDLQKEAADREQKKEKGRLEVRFAKNGGAFRKQHGLLELGITVENASSRGEVLTDFELEWEPNGRGRFLEEAAGFPELQSLYQLDASTPMAPGAVISGKLRFDLSNAPFGRAAFRVVGERNTAEMPLTWDEVKETRER